MINLGDEYQNFLTLIVLLITAEAVLQRCSVKKVSLEISQNSPENTCTRTSFLIKLQAYNFIEKETLVQMFSCEFCEISKNIFFAEHLWRTTAETFFRCQI